MWSMRRAVGLSSPVSRPSLMERMLIPREWSSSTARRALREVPVQPRHGHGVAGSEYPAELLPRGASHAPARGHVGKDAVVPQPVVMEDTALGGQPALSLRLGDPDVTEDCGGQRKSTDG